MVAMYPSSACSTCGQTVIPQFSFSPSPPPFSFPRPIRPSDNILRMTAETMHNLKPGETKTEDDVHFAIMVSPELKTAPSAGDNQATSSDSEAPREAR